MQRSKPINFSRVDTSYRKSDLARHSFFLILLFSSFLSAEQTSILMLMFFASSLFISKFRIGRSFFSLVAPFLALLFVGSINATYNSTIGIWKDIWYVGQAAVALGLGFVLARYESDLSRVFKIIVLAGAIAAFLHLFDMFLHWQEGLSLFDLRKEVRIKGDFISVIALSLIFTLPRHMLRINLFFYYLVLIICIMSLAISFSRTYIISLFVIVLILKGWVVFRLSSFVKLSVVFSLLALVIAQASITEDGVFLNKVVNSIDEVRVEDYSEMSDINLHWRGYESYRALIDFKEGNVFQQIFGQGLGATIDLGFFMKLGDEEFRYIPVLHNGYLYVLVKFGVLGLLIYIYFLINLIMKISYTGGQRLKLTDDKVPSFILASLGWILILTSLVIAGPFNKTAMLPVLLIVGILSAFMESNKNRSTFLKM